MTFYGETAESHVSKGQSSDLNVLYLQERLSQMTRGERNPVNSIVKKTKKHSYLQPCVCQWC